MGFLLYVYKFVRDTGELRTLENVAVAGCERLVGEYRGFEDIAQFSDGAFISLASDHHHFKFEFENQCAT